MKFKTLILRHKNKLIQIVCVCIFVLLLNSLLKERNELKNIPTLTAMHLKEPLIYTCCRPLNNSIRTNVYFLKTHKTGSATVRSIILRFAIRNSLDTLCVTDESYYSPLSDLSLKPRTITPNNKYHILAVHMRYTTNLKYYQYPDTSMVTIIRHPATAFQSMYSWNQMSRSTGMTFEQFLKAPVKPAEIHVKGNATAYKGYNRISVDLGFDWTKSNNMIAISEFVEKIDREFDFVMITEHMEASVVLLANLMGWPLEDMAYLNFHTRAEESDPYVLTEDDMNVLMELNKADTQLYFHFLRKFHKCVRQYGEDRLNSQIDRLRYINAQFKERCVGDEFVVDAYSNDQKVISYTAKNQSDLECVYATQLHPPLGAVAAKKQAQRLLQYSSHN